MAKTSKPTFFIMSAFLGVIIGVFALLELFYKKPAPPTPEEVAKPHLSWADQECERVVEDHLRAIDMFFADSKKNTRSFANEALSWGSKLRLIADYVPFTSGGRHETFIRGKFEKLVFKPSQLEDTIRQVVAGYLKHVESIEGQMLVRVRGDVADFPSTYLIAHIDKSELQAAYDEALLRVMKATASDLRIDITNELVSVIIGEVLVQVAVKMGVSAGILGTGAAWSPATFGIGLVVSVIVDQIISWVWDWYVDPKGNLAEELNRKLDEMNCLIVDGTDDVQGLRERLHAFAKERATVRSQAVLAILQPK